MPDLVIRNARIWTGDPARPAASAAVVRDGRFAHVGSEPEISAPPGAEVIDVGGRFVTPGFTDAHVHLLGTGLGMGSVQLKEVPSVEEALRRVGERVALSPAGSWVTGAGWDQNLWPGAAFPNRLHLDAISPDHPVVLTQASGHCTWVNSAGLRAAGITGATPSPEGGAIDIGDDGEPTGILRDNASRLVTAVMPRLTQTDRIAAIEEAVRSAHMLGVTGVHAMDVSRGEFQALHALNDSGRLGLRVRPFLSHQKLDEWIERGITTGDGDDMLRIGGVKFFTDGALGSLTAWMFEPYEDSTARGFPLQPVEDLERDVRHCLGRGLAPAVHAIGDRANHEALNIFERARALAPALPRRIEHAQLVRADDVARFAALGVTASVQPIHATQDQHKSDRSWGQRSRLAYAYRSLESSGADLAFGSDAPVETMDPLAGIHAAVTRRNAAGEPPGGWYPNQRVEIEDALRHYTTGPAKAVGEQQRFGRIAKGYHADFVVLSDDPRSQADPMHLLDLPVVITAVGGEIVYQTD
ncbi:MAG: amidohydrolase [Chloroflexi bacterium]|nr:amidohydrolase [Chloroflexota bacterium]